MNKIEEVINAGSIIDDLKRTQNIIINIDEFFRQSCRYEQSQCFGYQYIYRE